MSSQRAEIAVAADAGGATQGRTAAAAEWVIMEEMAASFCRRKRWRSDERPAPTRACRAVSAHQRSVRQQQQHRQCKLLISSARADRAGPLQCRTGVCRRLRSRCCLSTPAGAGQPRCQLRLGANSGRSPPPAQKESRRLLLCTAREHPPTTREHTRAFSGRSCSSRSLSEEATQLHPGRCQSACLARSALPCLTRSSEEKQLGWLTPTAVLPSLWRSQQHQPFQHILRLLNTNIDGKRKIMYALTEIKGVGRRYSNVVCKKADVDLAKRCVPSRLASRCTEGAN